MSDGACSKLSVKSAGLSFGLLWGGSVLIMALLTGIWGYGAPWTNLLASVYVGFNPSKPVGIAVGTLWGFADGFTGGAIFAWLYNRLL